MSQFPANVSTALSKLRAQVFALDSMAAPTVGFDRTQRASGMDFREPATIVERYGDVLQEAVLSNSHGRDFIWLGIIDWAYRIQRPQHLSTHLADLGNRVFYVSIEFERADTRGRFRLINSPHPGVFELRLRVAGEVPAGIYRGFTREQTIEINASLEEASTVLGVRAPVVVVQYPSWYPVAVGVPGGTVLYDCIDLVAGFENIPSTIVEIEKRLLQQADIVVTASGPLAKSLSEQRSSVVVRNAAEVGFFAKSTRNRVNASGTPVIGYFGAVAQWFAIDWITRCARAHPDWHFVIGGRIEGADIAEARTLPNVRFQGEIPYSELPDFLATFDVAVIPFKLTRLVECVNPVKLYEYMSQGKPVVSAALPEVLDATDMVYIARNERDFEQQISLALAEDCPELQERRRAWAMEHTWASRAAIFAETLANVTPKVSIAVLAYNNWNLTRACLHSVLTFSDYPNLEIIVVDNASTDETRERLEELRIRDPRLRVILNDANLGFAAGNNVGLRAATGEYVILLNNDTYVTRGWVRDLIRPLMLDQKVGLVGPLTNNIGNEQKLSMNYDTMPEMASAARRITRKYPRRRLDTNCVAFFCVGMKRALLHEIGMIEEAYGIGFFEDDDFCRRVLEAGYKIVVVDDVFVHHELSAAFKTFTGEEKAALMERNKSIFEQRWGPWTPHAYRNEPGFGA
jgi:GT2 family glycosyltransferase/glycosyltransferase involved in cell wall biosynthesis